MLVYDEFGEEWLDGDIRSSEKKKEAILTYYTERLRIYVVDNGVAWGMDILQVRLCGENILCDERTRSRYPKANDRSSWSFRPLNHISPSLYDARRSYSWIIRVSY